MKTDPSVTKQRLLAPEVVQTSAMDCGPAALKCLLEGFGIPVSYGRLREACQTDVDGTSINTIEDVAVQLGLHAEQTMVSADHFLLPEAGLLPAIVVVRLPDGMAHFVVVWRRHGPFLQVMDPAIGRRWMTPRQFLDDLYIHELSVPASGWREWAGSAAFLNTLRRRLNDLGIPMSALGKMTDAAVADSSWHSLATLDAATRMVTAIVAAGGLKRGEQLNRVIETFSERAQDAGLDKAQAIPDIYWSVRPAPPGPEEEATLLLRGAVLVHVGGRSRAQEEAPEETDGATLSPELVAALEEPPSRPWHELLTLLRADGLLAPAVLVAALLLAAAGIVVEALLFRGVIDLGRELGLVGQRLTAVGALLAFVAMLLLLELPIASAALRFGRRLEARLRIAFLEKIPRLGDRYFQSRLTSDMAERSHNVHKIRLLPDLGSQLTRSTFELLLTAAGIIWLDPASAGIALLAAVVAIGLPLLVQPVLAERDLRMRTHTGALSRFYLDALLGLIPVRTHGAEGAVRREHEGLLVDWARAGYGLQRVVVWVEGVHFLLGFGLAAWLLLNYLERSGEAGAVLLLVYWALHLPMLGQEVAIIAWQYPSHRNVTLRLLEPLGAPEEAGEMMDRGAADPGSSVVKQPQSPARGVAVALEGVQVRIAGHTILEDIDLNLAPGSHVGVVGSSGAGKSSLVGILLGWHRPARGRVLVDGEPLGGRVLERLRQQTAWVDPTVQIWNRSLIDNLNYGSSANSSLSIGQVIKTAELRRLLESLPEGLQTPLGEGGALVSGGEGQRVRLGRAMLRADVRLVILDEPFRGLDRQLRRELLTRARELWKNATLLCITHDVGDTQVFKRVLVVDGGRIVEDGAPADLAKKPDSHYRALLSAEEDLRQGLWSSGEWRRLRLEKGVLHENGQSL